jgi:hypothetical protein
MSDETERMWWLSLGLGGVVVGVVAGLLFGIAATAERINKHASEIWQAGKGIAGNTAAIWLLKQTNTTANQILAGTASLAQTAESLDRRLAALPGASERR